MSAVLLLLLGFGLVVAEIFFPSFGVLSILAVASFLGALALSWQQSGTLFVVVLVAILLGLPGAIWLAFRMFPRTPLGSRMLQGGATWKPEERAAVDQGAGRFVGRQGRAVSPLRPAGIAEFDGERVDVVTRGEHVEPGTPVRALRFVGNRLVVERANENPDSES